MYSCWYLLPRPPPASALNVGKTNPLEKYISLEECWRSFNTQRMKTCPMVTMSTIFLVKVINMVRERKAEQPGVHVDSPCLERAGGTASSFPPASLLLGCFTLSQGAEKLEWGTDRPKIFLSEVGEAHSLADHGSVPALHKGGGRQGRGCTCCARRCEPLGCKSRLRGALQAEIRPIL